MIVIIAPTYTLAQSYMQFMEFDRSECVLAGNLRDLRGVIPEVIHVVGLPTTDTGADIQTWLDFDYRALRAPQIDARDLLDQMQQTGAI